MARRWTVLCHDAGAARRGRDQGRTALRATGPEGSAKSMATIPHTRSPPTSASARSRSTSKPRPGSKSSTEWSARPTSSSKVSDRVLSTSSAFPGRASRSADPELIYASISGFGQTGPLGPEAGDGSGAAGVRSGRWRKIRGMMASRIEHRTYSSTWRRGCTHCTRSRAAVLLRRDGHRWTSYRNEFDGVRRQHYCHPSFEPIC